MGSKGLFIVIEGLDGSGKTTQMNLISQVLTSKGYKVLLTQEPTRGKIGEICRIYLKDKLTNPHADALIFAADRVEHYFEVVKPKVEEGFIVISDRYKISSMAYQGSAGVPIEWISKINSMSEDPDLSFYLDIDLDNAVTRLREDRPDLEKFENKQALLKVKEIYEERFGKELIRVDATQSPEIICEEISKHIFDKLNSSNSK